MNPSAISTADVVGGVASGGLKVASAVGLVFFAPLLTMASLGGVPEAPQSGASAAALAEIPPEHLAVIQQVGSATSVPWQVLAAIAKVESGFGTNMGPISFGEADVMEQFNTLFENLLNIGMGVGAAVAAFFVMWGAFLYMSAAGSPHQMERGKSAIVNALVGFSIVLLARVIAGMIQDSIGSP